VGIVYLLFYLMGCSHNVREVKQGKAPVRAEAPDGSVAAVKDLTSLPSPEKKKVILQ
jgi:hypothetical protein